MTNEKILTDVLFDRLDKWRHFPDYQLERRADIFFSLYLVGALSEVTGDEFEDEVIPEFPLKRDLIWPEYPTSKSVKIDYLITARDRKTVYLVELKTDDASRRDEQDTYLEKAKKVGMRAILDGLKQILTRTASQQKYYHLVAALERLGFWKAPDDIEKYIYPEPRRGLTQRIEKIALSDLDPKIEVVYVQPSPLESGLFIDFERLGKYVAKFDDPLSKRFAESLKRWRKPAGAERPK